MREQTLRKICEKVYKYLSDKDVSADVYPYGNGLPVIVVDIHWGDWKHDHVYAKVLLKEIGANHVNSEVTEEDGSDCYSAIHHFFVDESILDNLNLVSNR